MVAAGITDYSARNYTGCYWYYKIYEYVITMAAADIAYSPGLNGCCRVYRIDCPAL